ncbi:MAG TPA: nicotinate phosphoribosyltransferase [Vulgatibacter sp.]|nr:nicotinate phosphoribosyltransferase [Vulgatibacter sp.]
MGEALRTDLYELTMAAAYHREGIADRRAVCEIFVRKLPRRRSYLLVAGLELALRALESFRFGEDDLDFLASLPALETAFLDPTFRPFLEALRFRGDVWAMPEGTIALEGEPLLRVEAPLVEAQVVETVLLSLIGHSTTVASKAARVVDAADGVAVVEFGARRAHPEAAIDAARAAWIAGCAGTSNLEAARRWGIPAFGTASHMFTMVHDTELDAFRSYVDAFPTTSTLLIDTYDTLEGAARAIRAGGPGLAGVRLDSGDLGALAREVRRMLDEGGMEDTKIVASGDLDEGSIASLREGGAPIDVFGVGTKLTASTDAPALGVVYKVVAIEKDGELLPTAKFSRGKVMWPGAKQVHRRLDDDGILEWDQLSLADEPPPPGSSALLVPVMRGGRRVGPPEPIAVARERAAASLRSLPESLIRGVPRGERPAGPRPSARLLALLDEVHARVGGR